MGTVLAHRVQRTEAVAGPVPEIAKSHGSQLWPEACLVKSSLAAGEGHTGPQVPGLQVLRRGVVASGLRSGVYFLPICSLPIHFLDSVFS